jgi:hypothetical protein
VKAVVEPKKIEMEDIFKEPEIKSPTKPRSESPFKVPSVPDKKNARCQFYYLFKLTENLFGGISITYLWINGH